MQADADNSTEESVAAVFPDHVAAEAAIKQLTAGGFPLRSLSIVGKGYHTEEKVLGFYNTGDRVMFWGKRGAFWGGMWGLFFGGMFLTMPVTGPVLVLGFLTAAVISALEGAVLVGGMSALGGAFASIGIPENTVLQYETAIAADGFVVMMHGPSSDVARAEYVLKGLAPTHLAIHSGDQTFVDVGRLTTVQT